VFGQHGYHITCCTHSVNIHCHHVLHPPGACCWQEECSDSRTCLSAHLLSPSLAHHYTKAWQRLEKSWLSAAHLLCDCWACSTLRCVVALYFADTAKAHTSICSQQSLQYRWMRVLGRSVTVLIRVLRKGRMAPAHPANTKHRSTFACLRVKTNFATTAAKCFQTRVPLLRAPLLPWKGHLSSRWAPSALEAPAHAPM
jgi:hypothetical protein